ncbi:MAG: hypothetical protein RW306_17315 [Geobacteraceae bacterium]|nr:hypothetical protein [Geobacteraceae bacterium]
MKENEKGPTEFPWGLDSGGVRSRNRTGTAIPPGKYKSLSFISLEAFTEYCHNMAG